MKTYGRTGLYITFSWPRHQVNMSGQPHGPAASTPGKKPWYPPDRRLDGPKGQSGKFLTAMGLQLLGRLARSQSLYRLSYRGLIMRVVKCNKWRQTDIHILARKKWLRTNLAVYVGDAATVRWKLWWSKQSGSDSEQCCEFSLGRWRPEDIRFWDWPF
jgi:hypothetical protein